MLKIMLSRIGRSVYRSSRTTLNKGVFPGLRSAELSSCENGRLGLKKCYLTSGKHVLKEFDSVFRNHNLFCSQVRKYETYHPKKKKTEIPKEKNQKSDSKDLETSENYHPKKKAEIPKVKNQKSNSEESKAGGQWYQDKVLKRHMCVIGKRLIMCVIGVSSLLFLVLYLESKKISFQQFKNHLLEPGLVDHIVLLQSTAIIRVKSSPTNGSHANADTVQDFAGITSYESDRSFPMYFISIGSVKSFEDKLEKAQEVLGIDTHNYIPVIYASTYGWYSGALMYFLTLLLLALFIGRKAGISIGGPGGKAGTGIFSFGKAPITKRDKNSKEKVNMNRNMYGRMSSLFFPSIFHHSTNQNRNDLLFSIDFFRIQ